MACCEAWRSLSGPAVKVWIELRSRYNGNNNGDLSLSWDEGARLLGLGKATVGRAFQDLEARGFIVMTKRGQWYGRMATTWAVREGQPTDHPSLVYFGLGFAFGGLGAGLTVDGPNLFPPTTVPLL